MGLRPGGRDAAVVLFSICQTSSTHVRMTASRQRALTGLVGGLGPWMGRENMQAICLCSWGQLCSPRQPWEHGGDQFIAEHEHCDVLTC